MAQTGGNRWFDDEKKRREEEAAQKKAQQIEERRAAASRAQEKWTQVKAQSKSNAQSTAPSASAMKAGKSDRSMTKAKVDASLTGYEKKNEGDNDMAKVAGMHRQESAVYSDMSYDEAMGFATRIVYDDERDAFLTKWRKAAGKKGNKAYMESVPTMDEMRTAINSQTTGGIYQKAKESYSEGVQESFKNDVAAQKAVNTLKGITDVNGDAVNMNTADMPEIVRAIRTTASEQKRNKYVSALKTLTQTKGSRFYGLEFDSTQAKKFIDSAALTQENYKERTENYDRLFNPLEGNEEANAQAYAQEAQRIEESGDSDYVKRQMKAALNEAWENQTGKSIGEESQTAQESAPAQQSATEPQEAPAAQSAQEQPPEPQEENGDGEQQEKETQGPRQRSVPTYADALADEDFAKYYAARYGSIDLTRDPIRAAAYISTGNANQLTRKTQEAFNELIRTSAAARAVTGYSYQDAAAMGEEDAQNEDPFAVARTNAAMFDALNGDTTFVLGSTLAYYLNMARSDSFPQMLRDDMEGAIMEIGVAAEEAYENGELVFDKREKNLYDAYIEANPGVLEQVRGVVRTVDEIEKEAKRQEELSAQEAEKSAQELLAQHREQVESGVYTQEAYEHVLEEAPEVSAWSAGRDKTYKVLHREIYDEWMDDAQGGWYEKATSAYLKKSGLPDDMNTEEAESYKALLGRCMEDVLLSDLRVAQTLGYESLDALYSKWGGMDVEKMHARAEAAMRRLSASVSEEDVQTINYIGTGEGVGWMTAIGKGAEHGAVSAAGGMLETIWALGTIPKEGAPIAAHNMRVAYTQAYNPALAATMYRHDMYAYAESAPSKEQGDAIRAYLDAGYDPFQIGIDPGETFIMNAAKTANDRANALGMWAQENLNKAKGTAFEVSSATTGTLTMQAVATVGSAATGNAFLGMMMGYGMPTAAQEMREQMSEGRDRKGALVMGLAHGASDALANMASFARYQEKLSGLVGLSSLSAIGAQNAGDIGATRTILGMAKAFGKDFLGGAADTLKDEVITDEIKETLGWQVIGGAAEAALDGAGILGTICRGMGNIDIAQTAQEVLGNAWQNTLCTLPLAVLGGLGDGFKVARRYATELATTGSADAAKKTMEAIGEALESEENQAAFKKAMHEAQVGVEIVYQTMTNEEVGADVDAARAASEQEQAHAAEDAASEKRMEAAKSAYIEAKNSGDIDAANRAAQDYTKGRQGHNEHQREQKQKEQEAQEAYAQGMSKAAAAAEATVAQQEEGAGESARRKMRIAEIDEQIEEIGAAGNRLLAEDPNADVEYFADTLEELYNEKAELEAAEQEAQEKARQSEPAAQEPETAKAAEQEAAEPQETPEEAKERAEHERREMAQIEAEEMNPVYKTLRETKLYVDDTQRGNILNRTGLKTLGQVNRKFGLKLTRDWHATSLDSIMPELAELAPGRIAREIDVSEDALMDIVERKKELKGMQASVGETAYEKYLPDGAFYNIQDPVMQQTTSAVKKATGVDIVIAPLTNNVRAIYDRENNRIILSNRIGAGQMMRKAVMHELTHYIESSKGYAAYRDAVLKAAYLTDTDGKARKADEEKIRSTYEAAGIELSEESLQKELVAAATETIISDTDGRLVNRLLSRQEKGVIRRAISAIVGKLSGFVARQNAKREGRLEAYDAMEEAYDRLTNALIESGGQTGEADPTIDLDTTQRLWGDTTQVGEDGQMQFALAPNQFGNETAQELRTINDEVKELLAGTTHEAMSEQARLDAAWDAINTRGRDAVLDELMSKEQNTWDAQDNVNAALLSILANNEGDTVTAVAILTRYDAEGSHQGQVLETRKIIKKLTPEGAILGMIRSAERENAKKGVPKNAFPMGEEAPKSSGSGGNGSGSGGRRGTRLNPKDDPSTHPLYYDPNNPDYEKEAQKPTPGNYQIKADIAASHPLPEEAFGKGVFIDPNAKTEQTTFIEKQKKVVQKVVSDIYVRADELTRMLDGLSGDVSDANPWRLPLTDWKMALIDQYKLRKEDLPGTMYNRATRKQRQLAAIIASDDRLGSEGKKALCQQLEAIEKGYAVVTAADARYASSMAAEFHVIEGADAIIPKTQEGREVVGRMLDAQGNVKQASLYEKWTSLRFTNMLSAPTSAVRNIGANMIGFAAERPAEAIATFADTLISKKTGVRTQSIATIAERKAGYDAMGKEVVQTASDYLIKHVDTSTRRKYDVNGRGRVFESGFLEAYRTIVDFAMQVGDRPFYEKKYTEQKAILERIGWKTREEKDGKFILRDATPEEIHEEATMRALYSVLQEDNILVRKLNEMRRESRAWDIAMTTIMPFLQAPSNSSLRMMAYSPIGLGKAVAHGILFVNDVRKGTWTPREQNEVVTALGQGLTGTGVLMAGLGLAAAGFIVLGREDEENANRRDLEKSQGTPYGMYIKIGDQMHEISWMSPVSGALATGAHMYYALENGEGGAGLANAILSGMGDTIMDMPMVSGLNEIFRGYDDSANLYVRFANTAVSAMITQTLSPGILRSIAKATDPYVRDTSSRSWIMSEINSGVIQNYPVLRQMLLPKATDVTGDEKLQSGYYSWGKEHQNAALHFLDSFFSPTATIGEKNDEALFELLDLSYRAKENSFLPKTLIADNGKMTITKTMAKQMGTGDVGYTMELTDDERREANRLYGDMIFNGLSGVKYARPGGGAYDQNDLPGIRNMMSSGKWERMTDAERIEAVEKMKKNARELVTYRAVKGEL